MTLTRLEKEATLREVLSEVTLLDIGQLLKNTFVTLGCLGAFFVVIILVGSVAGTATGFHFSDLAIPAWAIWLVITWFYLWASTHDFSYHEFKASWYFPKLGWLGSLVVAAYLVGFVRISVAIFDMPLGVERGAAAIFAYLVYAGPFFLFFSAINIGHRKLLDKRTKASEAR